MQSYSRSKLFATIYGNATICLRFLQEINCMHNHVPHYNFLPNTLSCIWKKTSTYFVISNNCLYRISDYWPIIMQPVHCCINHFPFWPPPCMCERACRINSSPFSFSLYSNSEIEWEHRESSRNAWFRTVEQNRFRHCSMVHFTCSRPVYLSIHSEMVTRSIFGGVKAKCDSLFEIGSML